MDPGPVTSDPYLLFIPSGPNVNSEGVAVAWDQFRAMWVGCFQNGWEDLAGIQEVTP